MTPNRQQNDQLALTMKHRPLILELVEVEVETLRAEIVDPLLERDRAFEVWDQLDRLFDLVLHTNPRDARGAIVALDRPEALDDLYRAQELLEEVFRDRGWRAW